MKILITAVILTSAVIAQAAVSPAYRALTKIDAAITALSQGGKGLAKKNPSDVTVSSLQTTVDKRTGQTVLMIDVGYNKCVVYITALALPKGMVGATPYVGKVTECRKYMAVAAVPMVKYEELRPVIEAAAAKGTVVSTVVVERSPQGPKIKIN